jgi:hypothetical protein
MDGSVNISDPWLSHLTCHALGVTFLFPIKNKWAVADNTHMVDSLITLKI